MISVITPVYNGASYLRETIDSILNAINQKDIEYIVINDGSTDATALVLQDFLSKYSHSSVVNVEEGTGKNVGRMGAVVFEGTDDGKFIRVSCGGGWTDKQRIEIWADKAATLGQLGEVRADAATKNQDSDDVWSLRFPRFKTWRGFAHGEKL